MYNIKMMIKLDKTIRQWYTQSIRYNLTQWRWYNKYGWIRCERSADLRGTLRPVHCGSQWGDMCCCLRCWLRSGRRGSPGTSRRRHHPTACHRWAPSTTSRKNAAAPSATLARWRRPSSSCTDRSLEVVDWDLAGVAAEVLEAPCEDGGSSPAAIETERSLLSSWLVGCGCWEWVKRKLLRW